MNHIVKLAITDIKVACAQNYLNPDVNKNLQFLASDLNGMDHVQWVSIYDLFSLVMYSQLNSSLIINFAAKMAE